MLPEHYSSNGSHAEDWVEDAAKAAMLTARRRRLNASDAEELRSDMWLKVLTDHGRLLSRFEGRGSRQSYLNAVAERCLLDRRIRDWGKWRPTKAVRTSGPVAVLLDRMISRDGMPVDAAVAGSGRGTVIPGYGSLVGEDAKPSAKPASPRLR